MAVTLTTTQTRHQASVVALYTADGDATIQRPEKPIAGISFQSDGVDGGGTLTVLVSNDGTNFVAAGFNTSADPRNLTPVTSITAAGAWIMPLETAVGFKHYQFHLTGSTNPTLVLTVVFSYRN